MMLRLSNTIMNLYLAAGQKTGWNDQSSIGDNRRKGDYGAYGFKLLPAQGKPGAQGFHQTPGVFHIRAGFLVGVQAALLKLVLVIRVLDFFAEAFVNGGEGFIHLLFTAGFNLV